MMRSILGKSLLFGVIGALVLQIAIDGLFVLITFASSSAEQLAQLTHFTPVALIGGLYAGYIWWRANRGLSKAWSAVWAGMGATLGAYLFLIGYSILDSRYYFPVREGVFFGLMTRFIFLLGSVVGASIIALGRSSFRQLRMQKHVP